MGSIIHPWNLVMMMLMMTSVAAMVHSADDKAVGSVTGHHSEPRGDDANDLQHSIPTSMDDFKGLKRLKREENNSYEGNFNIKIHVMGFDYSGTSDDIYLRVTFASGKTWGTYEYIHNYFWAAQDYEYNKTKTYYGNSDRVKYVDIRNTGSDAFFPEWAIINGPEACDRYECEWRKICQRVQGSGFWEYTDYKACFVENDLLTMPCKRANANTALCG